MSPDECVSVILQQFRDRLIIIVVCKPVQSGHLRRLLAVVEVGPVFDQNFDDLMARLDRIVLVTLRFVAAEGHFDEGREALRIPAIDQRVHQVDTVLLVNLAINAFRLLDYGLADSKISIARSKV